MLWLAQKRVFAMVYHRLKSNIFFIIILFDFILNISVNTFSVKWAHSTKIKMRGSREGVAEGPDPLPGKSETFGAL